jgi:hypothetical protein
MNRVGISLLLPLGCKYVGQNSSKMGLKVLELAGGDRAVVANGRVVGPLADQVVFLVYICMRHQVDYYYNVAKTTPRIVLSSCHPLSHSVPCPSLRPDPLLHRTHSHAWLTILSSMLLKSSYFLLHYKIVISNLVSCFSFIRLFRF